eukprot:TRINITY_DN31554_c0_g1_i1.p1 TRINITY_DN31554_c0_g1~~TRINITY_DN31554_c0_g1_i1.p1  ORF type:complete len:611 (-),score=85.52 TRINITY_DN31554_c0_g1_i1:20-1852(-)
MQDDQDRFHTCSFCAAKIPGGRNKLFDHLLSSAACSAKLSKEQVAELCEKHDKPSAWAIAFSHAEDAKCSCEALLEVACGGTTPTNVTRASDHGMRGAWFAQETHCGAACDVVAFSVRGSAAKRDFASQASLEDINSRLRSNKVHALAACRLAPGDGGLEKYATYRQYQYVLPPRALGGFCEAMLNMTHRVPGDEVVGLEDGATGYSVDTTASCTCTSVHGDARQRKRKGTPPRRRDASATSSGMIDLQKRFSKILKRFSGRHNYHNFISPDGGRLTANYAAADRTILRFKAEWPTSPPGHASATSAVTATQVNQHAEMVRLSVGCVSMLRGQLRYMVSAAVAIQHGWLEEDALEVLTHERFIMHFPPAPPADFLAGVSFSAKHSQTIQVMLDALLAQQTPSDLPLVTAAASAQEGLDDWLKALEHACNTSITPCISAHRSPSIPPPLKDCSLSPAPNEYTRVLALLQSASWPATSVSRSMVIEGNGSSMNVSASNVGDWKERAYSADSELARACFDLERILLPERLPSSHVCVNRNAQFKPHLDSGKGRGQSLSMIVALGDYSGGELMVEGVSHDIRYSPLEFDGWHERHWTNPFQGERFSLVFFSLAE